jgi:hypothetical protein
MRPPGCLYVCEPPLLNFECMNQSLLNLVIIYDDTLVFLDGVLHKSLSLFCVSTFLSPPVSLLGNGSVDTFPRQHIQATIEELLEACFSIRSVSYQRRVRGSVYVSPLSLLGNCLVNRFPRQRWIVGCVVLYAVRVVSKESRQSVLPRTSS